MPYYLSYAAAPSAQYLSILCRHVYAVVTDPQYPSTIASIDFHTPGVGHLKRIYTPGLYEHNQALETLSSKSFMVKHWLESHQTEPLESDRYLAKVIRYTRTSFERDKS